jgi:glucose/arabinose dehydrogenase
VAGCGGCGSEPGAKTTGSSATAAQDDPTVHAAKGVQLRRVGSFSSPIFVTAPRGDNSRLFVVERAGRIQVLQGGRKLERPFLDISSNVRTDSERGLLSMAFAPDYATSGRFYVYFTDKSGDIRIQEFRRSAGNANVADTGSARNLLTIDHREFGNHDGGQLQFGPDKHLYAGVGDGGGAGDPHNHGQSLGTRLAKLLRIDPRHPAGGRPYGVKGNPFASRRGAQPEIWAYGLRNPWRFSFDRSTGDLVIGDVGQDSEEEIDFARRGRGRGANYGWNVFEGRRRFRGGSAPGAVRPRVTHSHGNGYCSITGGYVVRDKSLGSLYGRYVYGDLCKSGLRSVKLGRSGGASGDRAVPGVSVSQLVSFGEDARGRVYAVSLDGGVFRLAPK